MDSTIAYGVSATIWFNLVNNNIIGCCESFKNALILIDSIDIECDIPVTITLNFPNNNTIRCDDTPTNTLNILSTIVIACGVTPITLNLVKLEVI